MRNTTAENCDRCRAFQQVIQINSAADWEPVLLEFLEKVKKGTLAMEDGELQGGDLINCQLRCTHCNRLFVVSMETYHGRGGIVEPSS